MMLCYSFISAVGFSGLYWVANLLLSDIEVSSRE